ncbi:conjugal transfer protein TraE [Salmonella enterica subsp. enterica serovar Typhimurium]|nr:conjugal transfer protein TraE [Salmonella enterica subsp. enterica serovar Typhimurium]EKR1718884.1 conjugal transfer protein TraE [Salmonella enterica subsp. enterica serovar Thompson]HAE9013216.1 conjugal transfer protein TraE [Salmonella enterica subsp. enterica serovar Thompson]
MYSFTQLIQSLLSSGHSKAVQESVSADSTGPKELTSIRLKPSTRAYLQAQSDHLGISLSQSINMIIDGVVELETSPVKNSFDTIYDRIMMLFDSHDIMPLDRRRMLSKYGVTTAILKSRDDFLDLVTPEMISDLSDWFCVRQKWLNGVSTEICETRNIIWYKNAEGMVLTMMEQALLNKGLKVYVIKRHGIDLQRAEEIDDTANNLDMGFIFETSRTVAGVTFRRFEICEFQRWNYVRCREHLKLIFKFLDQYSERFRQSRSPISFDGISLEDEVLEPLCNGKLLPAQLSKEFYHHQIWYPEDHIADVNHQYRSMDFERYLDGLIKGPTKTISLKTTEFKSKEWEVKLYGTEEDTLTYYSLSEALLDQAQRYSETNQNALNTDS